MTTGRVKRGRLHGQKRYRDYNRPLDIEHFTYVQSGLRTAIRKPVSSWASSVAHAEARGCTQTQASIEELHLHLLLSTEGMPVPSAVRLDGAIRAVAKCYIKRQLRGPN